MLYDVHSPSVLLRYSDVDHPGIPNSNLNDEDPDLVLLYKDQCVAEQKAFDIAWDVLMDKKYLELRSCIYGNEREFYRFRELSINCVIATDLVDEEMRSARLERWDALLSVPIEEWTLGGKEVMMVIEHIIQVSDIAHTMQHWHVYCKWSEKMFQERMKAYQTGLEDKDPSEYWYDHELQFFDDYVIPLASRIKEFQVFGVAGNECLSYALDNKAEWVLNGRAIVKSLTESFENGDRSFWESRVFHDDFNESGSITFEDLKS